MIEFYIQDHVLNCSRQLVELFQYTMSYHERSSIYLIVKIAITATVKAIFTLLSVHLLLLMMLMMKINLKI